MSFLERLTQTAYRFEFHATMRRLEALFPELPRFGEAVRPSDESVRVGQEATLAFAPSEVSAFKTGEDGRPSQMTVAFLGLMGPNGPLPLHFTEYARQRIRHVGDRTISAFINLFNHRMLLLFHRAWAQVEPTVIQDRPKARRFETYLGSLMGMGLSELQNRGEVPDHGILQYVGWFANPVRSAEGIRAILADYFDVPVSIEEFQGEWLELPEESRLMLGGPPEVSALGIGTILGCRAYAVQSRFRVVLGPLSHEKYVQFLPGSFALTQLKNFVRAYAGDEFAWDLRLKLREDASIQVRLGGTQQLSYNARLGKKSTATDVVIDPFTHSSRRYTS
jgi:type VI secretion system protein ImpH